MPRSQQGQIYQNMAIFLQYLLNCWSICNQLGLIVQHHKPESCGKRKMHYCIQGQGHSKGSKCQWVIVWMISSELQNIWCVDASSWARVSCEKEKKKMFAIVKVKVAVGVHIIKLWLFLLYLLNCSPDVIPRSGELRMQKLKVPSGENTRRIAHYGTTGNFSLSAALATGGWQALRH